MPQLFIFSIEKGFYSYDAAKYETICYHGRQILISTFLIWEDTIMITNGILELLHNAIYEYDKKCGKSYLVAFSSGRKNEMNVIQLHFTQSYFWHLLGCKLVEDSVQGKKAAYYKCLKREDISDKVNTIHSFSEIQDKYNAFMQVFDFVKNAKNMKIGFTENCPEQFIFRTGIGSLSGMIGYDYPEKGKHGYLIPKSAQRKSLSKVSRNLNKILFILSKKNENTFYFNMEYEIKNGVFEALKAQIPENIAIRCNDSDGIELSAAEAAVAKSCLNKIRDQNI